jgi:hypothetical protein
MMTTMQDVRATIPDLREAMPDFGEVIPDLRRAMPDARAAIPALREAIADVRADLPAGPWRRGRPSLVRRIAIVVFVGLALTAVAWLVMAVVERRRLDARLRATTEDATAISRAEDEGLGAEFEGMAADEAFPSTAGFESTVSRSSGKTDATSVLDAAPPMVGATTSSVNGGQTDGR